MHKREYDRPPAGDWRRIGPYYRIKRGEFVFWAVVTGSARGAHFRDLKINGDCLDIDRDRLLNAAISNISYFISTRGKYDLITIPPHSGEGWSWAGEVAKRISMKAEIDFVKVFKDHGRKKRYSLKSKLAKFRFETEKVIKGQKILIFDDFTHTGGTMVRCMKILSRENHVDGVVLCA